MRIHPLLLAGSLLLAVPAHASVGVEALRYSSSPERDRLVLDLDGPARYSLAQDGQTLTLKIRNGLLHADIPSVFPVGLITSISTEKGPRGQATLRIVTSRPVTPTSFMLKPEGALGDRLVLDLSPADDDAQNELETSPQQELVEPPATLPEKSWKGTVVIGVDAGHGGQDPGAVGREGTYEKDVTLGIARAIQTESRRLKGIKVVLTRSDDRFLPLGDRPKKARAQGAQIFVSIHADAADNPSAKGASVYVLSAKGAGDRAARLLARKENLADLAGDGAGVKGRGLSAVLLDMSQQYSMGAGRQMAGHVLGRLGEVAPLHRARYGEAGFAVLKSHDLPSILVETGYISNPTEEARLATASYQRTLAKKILAGLQDYLRGDRLPAGITHAVQERPAAKITQPAQWQAYRVRSGDQLLKISARFNTPASLIRAANPSLRKGLLAGATLRIPIKAEDTPAPAVPAVPVKTWDYQVPPGAALSTLAARYHTTPAAIRALNDGLPHGLLAGATLRMPGEAPEDKLAPATEQTTGYQVQRGDQLYQLAVRFKTTAAHLRELNAGLPRGLLAGVTIQVPAPPKARTYTVKPGDALILIAKQHDTTVDALTARNPVLRRGLHPGMILTIPEEKS